LKFKVIIPHISVSDFRIRFKLAISFTDISTNSISSINHEDQFSISKIKPQFHSFHLIFKRPMRSKLFETNPNEASAKYHLISFSKMNTNTRFENVSIDDNIRLASSLSVPQNTIKTQSRVWKQFSVFFKERNYELMAITSVNRLLDIVQNRRFNMKKTYKE
jgi:hypothetical protein